MTRFLFLAGLASCIDPAPGEPAGDGSVLDAQRPDAAATCPDDRFGLGTLDLPAATLELGRHENLVACAEGDVFAVRAPAGIALSAVVAADRPVVVRWIAEGLPDVEASGRNPLIRQRNPASGLRVSIAPAVPGPAVRYRLVLGLAPLTCDEPAEPDGLDAPRPLEGAVEGVVCAGDEDWVWLDGPPGAAADVNLQALGGQGVRLEALRGAVVTARLETTAEGTLGLLVPAGGALLRIQPVGQGGGWRVRAQLDDGPTVSGRAQGTLEAVDRVASAAGLGPPVARLAVGIQLEALHIETGRLAGISQIEANGSFSLDYWGPVGTYRLQMRAQVGGVLVGPADAEPWAEDLGALTPGNPEEVGARALDPNQPTAAAVHAALVLAEGIERARPFFEGPEVPLRVRWAPGVSAPCGTCFRTESGDIELSGALDEHDAWEDAVLLHELGHHLAAVHGRDDSPGGRHDGSRTWPGLAWSEGFATFHAAWQLGSPQLRDVRPGRLSELDLESLEDPRAFGTSDGTLAGDVSELLVAAVLWDVLDGGLEPGDSVAIPEADLLPALLGGLVALDDDLGAPGLDLADVLPVLQALAPTADLPAITQARGYPWP